MNKIGTYLCAWLMFGCLNSIAQTKSSDCQKFRTGLFYTYPKNSNGYLIYVRDETTQMEIDKLTGDTSVWNVSWKNDCTYILSYSSAQGALAVLGKAYGKIEVEVKIVEHSDEYYVYKTVANKAGSVAAISDTVWLKEMPSKIKNRAIVDASFPGGNAAWTEYINRALSKEEKSLGRSKKEGTCLVRFLVGSDGSITNVEALTMKGSRIAKIVIDAVKDGPKWIPGTVDGKPTKMVKIQPVVLVLEDAGK